MIENNMKMTNGFQFDNRKPICPPKEARVIVREVFDENIELGIDNDGKLHIGTNQQREIIWPENYCVDNFVAENGTAIWTSFNAIVCFKPSSQDHYIINSACMIISCVFILMTVMVYTWLPELNNLHGRILISYLICLFVGYALIASMKMLLYFNKNSREMCDVLTIVAYFFLLAAFFWLNVMCFDIWRTFSGIHGVMTNKIRARDKFCTYFLYAFGITIMLTILLILLEYYPMSNKRTSCFLSGNNRFLYLYIPILILWLADTTFFILTIVKIREIKRQTSVLNSKDSVTHDVQNKERGRLCLYIKLYIVMGVNWVLEVVSAHAAQNNNIWVYTDAYNALIGFFIFFIFVCKRKTFLLMKKRYAQFLGKPVVRSQSSTRTMTTSVKITRV
ncbi:unnamed protein product, partial [Brenthis ino]